MSWLKNIRNDVAGAVEALPAIAAVAATTAVIRDWVPEIERKDLKRREIHIAPEGRSTEMISRGAKRTKITVWVALIEPLLNRNREQDQASANHDLADAIIDGLLGKRIGGLANAICVTAEQPVTTVPEHWRKLRQFSSFIKLTLEQ